MKFRLLGTVLFTSVSVLALTSYVEQAHYDHSLYAEFNSQENRLLSELTGVVIKDSFPLTPGTPQDFADLGDEYGGESSLAPIDDALSDAEPLEDAVDKTMISVNPDDFIEVPEAIDNYDLAFVSGDSGSPVSSVQIYSDDNDPDSLVQDNSDKTYIIPPMAILSNESEKNFVPDTEEPEKVASLLELVPSEIEKMHSASYDVKDTTAAIKPNTIDSVDPLFITPIGSESAVQLARSHTRELVTLADHITGYPFNGIGGKTKEHLFEIPNSMEAPGEYVVTHYTGNEYKLNDHPGWCLTIAGFYGADGRPYYWINEGALPRFDGRPGEVAQALSMKATSLDNVKDTLLQDGETLSLRIVCFEGYWDGVSPQQHAALLRVISGLKLGKETVIQG